MRVVLVMLCFLIAPAAYAETIEATTQQGEKVRLHPNGRWEYIDQAKQAEAKKTFDSYPENRSPDAQGQILGIGRAALPGDKDYNRGTLNPKMR